MKANEDNLRGSVQGRSCSTLITQNHFLCDPPSSSYNAHSLFTEWGHWADSVYKLGCPLFVCLSVCLFVCPLQKPIFEKSYYSHLQRSQALEIIYKKNRLTKVDKLILYQILKCLLRNGVKLPHRFFFFFSFQMTLTVLYWGTPCSLEKVNEESCSSI